MEQNTSPALSRDETDALIKKHWDEIAPIMEKNGKEQEQALRGLGVDVGELKKHYQFLFDKSDELAEKNRAAFKRINFVSLLSAVSTAIAFVFIPKKHFTGNPADPQSGSNVFKTLAGFCASVTAFVAGNFLATLGFTGAIRKESMYYNGLKCDLMREELAIAMENRDQGINTATPLPETPTPEREPFAKAAPLPSAVQRYQQEVRKPVEIS